MSTFTRKAGGSAAAAELGTRPGANGQVLVSFGQADLDRLLRGGLPLGSVTLILEDAWTRHHVALLRYFVGEGAACGHSVLFAAGKEPEGGVSNFAPRLADPRADAMEAEAKKLAEEEDGVQLRIAWQYGKYLRQHSGSIAGGSGSSNGSGAGPQSPALVLQGSAGRQRPPGPPVGRDWCHSFDLSKHPAAPPAERSNGAHANPPHLFLIDGGDARDALAAATTSFVDARKAKSGAECVGRIAVLSLGGEEWGLGVGSPGASRAVVQSLLALKAAVRDTRCCAVVTVPAALHSESDRARMLHAADAVIALEAVQDDSDLARLAPNAKTVTGLLHLRKLPSLGAVASPPIPVPLYLVRHSRRKMVITAVEYDPDAEEAEAAGAGGGQSAGAAAVLCGGGPPQKKASDFEF